jgi:hypothetical protein
MFGILLLIPIMLILGVIFLMASIAAGIGLILKLTFSIIFIPIKILLWLIGLIF